MLGGFVTLFGSAIVCSFLFAISYPPFPNIGSLTRNDRASTSAEVGAAYHTTDHATRETASVAEKSPNIGSNNTEGDERERLQKAANERGLTIATWLLAYATVALVAVVIAQACMFYYQLRLMKDTLKETEASSKTAIKHANAIIQANSPILVVADIKLVPYTSWQARDGAADRVLPGQYIPEFCRVLINVQNIGRNSLRIKAICIERQISERLPPIPAYQSVSRKWQPWLVPFDAKWFMPDDEIAAIDFPTNDKRLVDSGHRTLWIYGYFTYLNVLEEELTHKFFARWDCYLGLIRENRQNYT